MIKYILLIYIAFLSLIPQVSFAQLEKHQATQILRFAHFVEWPGMERQLSFRIGVLTNNNSHPILPELKSLAKDMQIAGKNVEIIEFTSLDDLRAIHIMFVPNNRIGQLRRTNQVLLGIPVLYITETLDSMHSLSVINMFIEDNRLVYRLNKERAQELNLNLSQYIINNASN